MGNRQQFGWTRAAALLTLVGYLFWLVITGLKFLLQAIVRVI